MSPIAISSVVFLCICGGTILGMLIRAMLHERHLSADSKDTVKLAMGLIATSSIPTPFLVVLVFWVTILFASFTLFAPPSPICLGSLFVCALSVAAAIFLILELDRPFVGMIRISSAPLRDALAQLGR